MIRAGILNVTGYIGMEVARILARHPEVNLVAVTGRGAAGQKLNEYLPHLDSDLIIEAELDREVDVIFSALPHKASAEGLLPFIKQNLKVLDLSADFRLKNASEYEVWYQTAHPAPKLLSEAVYGLPELNAPKIAAAKLVACPGCYPTAAVLALAPLVREGVIEPEIIIDAKSGISGAGRTLSLHVHFSEANESVSAYALEGHRHLPEIIQALSELSPGIKLKVTFIPHLIPMTRGILCTCYAPLRREIEPRELKELYREFYSGQPFIRVVDFPPQTKQTWGSNFCLIHPRLDLRTGRIIVLSALDNLIKGGAGQAVQNMNLMFGLPQTLGLEALPLFP